MNEEIVLQFHKSYTIGAIDLILIQVSVILFYLDHDHAQVKLREMKPGMLSQELKEALGIPEGAPPPWLINMQV